MSAELLVIAGILIVISLGISVPGIVSLLIAINIFCFSIHAPLGFAGAIALSALILAFPLVSLLASALIDRFCEQGRVQPKLQMIAVCFAMALIFESNAFVGYFGEALIIVQEPSYLKLTAFVISLLNSVAFCSGLIAFTAILLAALFEFPMAWINNSAEIRIVLPHAALRQLLVLISISVVMSFAIGLCVAELKPTLILSNTK